MKLKRPLALYGLLATLLIVTFQNCGQNGQLEGALTSGQATPVSQSPGSGYLEIGAPSQSSGSGAQTSEDLPDNLDQPEDQSRPQWGFNDITHEKECADIKGSDIYLTIKNISSEGSEASLFEINEIDKAISVMKSDLRVRASVSASVSELQLELGDNGNYLLGEDEKVYGLKTPSAETSGIKVKLLAPVQIEASKEYQLKLNLDLSQQIVIDGRKCLMKPVIQSAAIVEI